ncbi:MAG: NAD(P)H-hydrate epimerase [Burkholderiaceae bacterium]
MKRILPIKRPVALFDLARTREIERKAAASLTLHTLMRRAGEATARLALAIAPNARQFWIAAGPGNNGGDGFDAAIHLLRSGKQVDLSMLGDPAALPVDARDAFARAQAAGVRIHPGATRPPQESQMAIDALLGAGISRAPQGKIADCIRALNGLECPVLAIDLPSGLDAGTGQPVGDACVVAAHTLAMLTLKPGLFTGAPPAAGHNGTRRVGMWIERGVHDAGP